MWPSSDPDDPRPASGPAPKGVGNGEAAASLAGRPGATAVMIHNLETGTMVACADLS